MANWTTRGARFTDEEIEIIEKYKKQNNLTDNQLIRQGVHLMVQFLAVKELLTTPDAKVFQSLIKDVTKITKSKKYQDDLNNVVERWGKKFKENELKKFEIELKSLEEEDKIFKQKRTRGRIPDKLKKNK